MNFNEVIFTSDLLRVDKTQKDKLENPQRINIEWIFELFNEEISNATGKQCRKIIGSNNSDLFSRLDMYKKLGLPITTESWIKIYEGNYKFDIIEEYLSTVFSSTNLIISYELPVYMLKFFNKNKIKYIDLAIHPIRYMNDYIFGIRTNVDEIREKFKRFKISEELMKQFTKLYKAKSKRVFQRILNPNSAVFLGQTEIDASLICNGIIPDLELVEYYLRKFTNDYEVVYYKAHPHSKIIPQLKNLVNSIKGCEWLEANIYMLLAKEEIETFISFSSGSLEEAKMFNKSVKRLIKCNNFFDEKEKINECFKYIPITKNIFYQEFWDYIFMDTNLPKLLIDEPYTHIIRQTLNMKWGN